MDRLRDVMKPRSATALPTRRSLLLAACGSVVLCWIGKADAATSLHPQKVADGVWFVQGESALGSVANRNFVANAGFVSTDDGVVVIDALGSPALANDLIGDIRRLTSQPIRYVIVTHYHADRTHGLQSFKAIGVEIIKPC
jgi:glyoxylase-like metal-dependent hydrolase (beta-lactamase superfamily II)